MRNRTNTFSVRLSEKELETLNKAIEKCGLTKSAFIRTVARQYLPKPRPPNGYDEMLSELTDISTNLYYLSDIASNTGEIDANDIRKQAGRLDKAILQINKFYTVPDKIKGGDAIWQQQKYGT